MENQTHPEYTTPRLVEFGRVEDITLGFFGGSFDSLFGKNIDGGWNFGGDGDDHRGRHTSS